MALYQKEALYTLIISIAFIALKAFLLPDLGAFNLELALVLLALYNVALWAVRILLGIKYRVLAEREKTVRLHAAMIAIHGLLAVMFIYAAVLYLMHREELQVPLQQVLNLAYHSWISFYVFWSGSTLILHRGVGLKI
ncbi:MAG: hypothetical protein K0B87_03155 [Candidatus Syntrophosphaera sp.]|nr:hypothetical protein [Candidatus Syntrophosphaera sp.]